MSEINPLLDILPVSDEPLDVEIFDPPLCCPTGLCGPTLDQTLLDVNEMIMALQAEKLRVERYQMTSHPNAFLRNAAVMKLIRERQLDALPITIVRGQIIKVGEYPTYAEVKGALNGTHSSH
ncbi:MAG: arsenite efflux transporter metallochaperone ArsD [Anaerolineales bacterium]